jgi:hypothetical protein
MATQHHRPFAGTRATVRWVCLLGALCASSCQDSCPVPTTPVFASFPFYQQRREVEEDMRGVVGKPCPSITLGGRGLCFAFEGTPLYAEGPEARAIFEPLVGKRVSLRGKRVDIGSGPEIWPALVSECP